MKPVREPMKLTNLVLQRPIMTAAGSGEEVVPASDSLIPCLRHRSAVFTRPRAPLGSQ
jgi:hypothetical protein